MHPPEGGHFFDHLPCGREPAFDADPLPELAIETPVVGFAAAQNAGHADARTRIVHSWSVASTPRSEKRGRRGRPGSAGALAAQPLRSLRGDVALRRARCPVGAAWAPRAAGCAGSSRAPPVSGPLSSSSTPAANPPPPPVS